jgi:hypothetical protein
MLDTQDIEKPFAEISVLVEPVAGNGYRASTGEPLSLVAEGATRDEVLEQMKARVAERLAATGMSMVRLRVPVSDQVAAPNPWAVGRGMFRDNPLYDQWQEAIREYRRQMDEDPDVL